MFRWLFFREFCFRERRVTRLRTWYWSKLFAEFGGGARVYGRLVVYCPWKVRIGERSTLNEGVMLNGPGGITIGSDVHISPDVLINSSGADYHAPRGKRGHIRAPVVIEDGVWICSGAIISPGVTIGADSVVAAGAVVTHDVESNTVVAGIPAKKINDIVRV